MFPSSQISDPALNPSPQWVSQIPFGNSPVPFGLSYSELGHIQKELEQNGFRPEPVGTEKWDDGNTSNGDECKGDGASQAAFSNVKQTHGPGDYNQSEREQNGV